MLKTIRYKNISDETLAGLGGVSPCVVSEGVITSELNFEYLIAEDVDFTKDAVFLYDADNKLERVFSYYELNLSSYMNAQRSGNTVLHGDGVCDNAEQVIEKYKLNDSELQFTVVLTPIKRCEQPANDGWRWHKWGKYIGAQYPMAEYIYDEVAIELVYVFHIFEWKDGAIDK